MRNYRSISHLVVYFTISIVLVEGNQITLAPNFSEIYLIGTKVRPFRITGEESKPSIACPTFRDNFL